MSPLGQLRINDRESRELCAHSILSLKNEVFRLVD